MPKLVTFTGARTGERVTVRPLIVALEGALVWLRGHDPDASVDWEVVKVRLARSVSLTFRSESANGTISERMRNLSRLQRKRMPDVAPRLTDEDIEGTKELASVIGRGFASMKISSPGDPTVKVTPVLVERVEAIARTVRATWYEWTELRGTIDQITVSPTAARFRLRHQITNAEIGCDFNLELLESVKDALSHRVEVYGKVRYNRADQPKSMIVKTIRKLPDRSPPFKTVPAVDITSGMDSADYVERVRGGEELT